MNVYLKSVTLKLLMEFVVAHGKTAKVRLVAIEVYVVEYFCQSAVIDFAVGNDVKTAERYVAPTYHLQSVFDGVEVQGRLAARKNQAAYPVLAMSEQFVDGTFVYVDTLRSAAQTVRAAHIAFTGYFDAKAINKHDALCRNFDGVRFFIGGFLVRRFCFRLCVRFHRFLFRGFSGGLFGRFCRNGSFDGLVFEVIASVRDNAVADVHHEAAKCVMLCDGYAERVFALFRVTHQEIGHIVIVAFIRLFRVAVGGADNGVDDLLQHFADLRVAIRGFAHFDFCSR